MEEVDEDEGESPPTLPPGDPRLFVLESLYHSITPLPGDPGGRRRVTMEEVDEDDEELLPTLPPDDLRLLVLESQYFTTPLPSDSIASDVDDAKDSEGENESPDETDGGEISPPSLVFHFHVTHSDHGQFVEDRRHHLAQLIPGLLQSDQITRHSSMHQLHWTGEDDKHGVCQDAFDDALHFLEVRSAHIAEPPPLWWNVLTVSMHYDSGGLSRAPT
ncbi:hypothetical protein C8R43DRAFT_1122608 [Mycena crocata]|nr:hypothetical protein C8R43DRAFT_1122608 [Mycena crocata]